MFAVAILVFVVELIVVPALLLENTVFELVFPPFAVAQIAPFPDELTPKHKPALVVVPLPVHPKVVGYVPLPAAKFSVQLFSARLPDASSTGTLLAPLPAVYEVPQADPVEFAMPAPGYVIPAVPHCIASGEVVITDATLPIAGVPLIGMIGVDSTPLAVISAVTPSGWTVPTDEVVAIGVVPPPPPPPENPA